MPDSIIVASGYDKGSGAGFVVVAPESSPTSKPSGKVECAFGVEVPGADITIATGVFIPEGGGGNTTLSAETLGDGLWFEAPTERGTIEITIPLEAEEGVDYEEYIVLVFSFVPIIFSSNGSEISTKELYVAGFNNVDNKWIGVIYSINILTGITSEVFTGAPYNLLSWNSCLTSASSDTIVFKATDGAYRLKNGVLATIMTSGIEDTIATFHIVDLVLWIFHRDGLNSTQKENGYINLLKYNILSLALVSESLINIGYAQKIAHVFSDSTFIAYRGGENVGTSLRGNITKYSSACEELWSCKSGPRYPSLAEYKPAFRDSIQVIIAQNEPMEGYYDSGDLWIEFSFAYPAVHQLYQAANESTWQSCNSDEDYELAEAIVSMSGRGTFTLFFSDEDPILESSSAYDLWLDEESILYSRRMETTYGNWGISASDNNIAVESTGDIYCLWYCNETSYGGQYAGLTKIRDGEALWAKHALFLDQYAHEERLYVDYNTLLLGIRPDGVCMLAVAKLDHDTWSSFMTVSAIDTDGSVLWSKELEYNNLPIDASAEASMHIIDDTTMCLSCGASGVFAVSLDLATPGEIVWHNSGSGE